jgi:hypothetical protein
MLAAEKAELSREIPSHLILIVSAELLALLPSPVVLRDYTLVTPGPRTDTRNGVPLDR